MNRACLSNMHISSGHCSPRRNMHTKAPSCTVLLCMMTKMEHPACLPTGTQCKKVRCVLKFLSLEPFKGRDPFQGTCFLKTIKTSCFCFENPRYVLMYRNTQVNISQRGQKATCLDDPREVRGVWSWEWGRRGGLPSSALRATEL